MSNIDIANEFSFGKGLTADQVEQLPKFNLARGKIIPIQLNADFDETTWQTSNIAKDDSNYDLYITNYPTPFFIIASSQVYNINKVSSMPYNDPRNGKNSDTTTVLQYTVVQGDEADYPQQYSTTESATVDAGGNGQLARNFYFTPFQGQITKNMVPVYLLPIKTTIKDSPDTYLYTFVRADIFITDTSTTSSGVGSGYSYIDYLKNPQNYLDLNQPSSLPNYTNLPDPYPYPYNQTYIYVKNLVFLATNYIGNSASVNSHSSFCRFLTYDDMYNITAAGNNFSQGNTAGPVFFGLNDLPFINDGKSIPNPPPYPVSLYPTNPPYGNDSIPPYYIFSGRPYSIFFGLHLNTNTFKTSNATYGGTFNNYAKNTDTVSTPNIQLPDNAKGYPINFLTSLGNNNPTSGAPNTTSNNTSYVKVFNTNSTNTQSFFQNNSSNYIGSTYDMDEYYIANSRTDPSYGFTGGSNFYNIYKFSLNKYIRFYSGTDGYTPMEIPYDTNYKCDYNGAAYNGYMPTGLNDYNLLNCNTIQTGLVQNMTLQFVPLSYFVSPPENVVPSVTDISMALPINFANTVSYENVYINELSFGTSYTVSADPLSPNYDSNLSKYTQISIQLVGGGGGGAAGNSVSDNRGGGGGGSGYMVGYVGGVAPNTWSYNLSNPFDRTTYILPPNWTITVTLGTGGTGGVSDGASGTNGNPTIIDIYDSSMVLVKSNQALGGIAGDAGNSSRNGNGGGGFNGGGGGENKSGPGTGDSGVGGTGIGGLTGGTGTTTFSTIYAGDGGGLEGGPGATAANGALDHTAGGGGGGGSGVITGSQTGGSGSPDGNPPVGGTGNPNGIDYTGAGGGGGSYFGGPTPSTGGNGGIGYAVLQFAAPFANEFKFPNPDNNPVQYPTTLPTTNSSNIVNPVNLFTYVSSLYANSSSILCETDLKPNSKCGFIPTEYYNSLNRYFYIEAPDLASASPNCTTGIEYDAPVVVDQIDGINVYNSESCGSYTGTEQHLCVPNFLHLSDVSEKPFKCIINPLPTINPEYVYENYYGMYEETLGSVINNNNLPNYFKQIPDKSVNFTIPSYIPTQYPKPANVPGSTKEETFWNSTLFIVLAIVIGVTILIVIIILIVKFGKKPEPYESVRARYVS